MEIKFSKIRCCKKKKVKKEDPKPEVIDPVEEEIFSEESAISINRRIYNYSKFTKEHQTSIYKGFNLLTILKDIFIKQCKPGKQCVKKHVYTRLPILKWLKKYNLKENFLADILAGLTVGIMHIPQGMGYALLANVSPIYGLYTSFFPVLIYCIFGTSKQLSMGTFSVVSLMVGSVITDLEKKYAPPQGFNRTLFDMGLQANLTAGSDPSEYLSDNRDRAKALIAMSNAFWVGLIQLFMFVLQLGFLTSYLSEPMIGGFVTGSAIHVFTAQMKFTFGVNLTSYSGVFKIPKTYIELFSKIPQFNLAAVLISFVCITLLFVIKIHISERFQHKIPVPFPTELLIIIFGTLISYLAKFENKFKVKTIGPIPPGFPTPEVPPLFIIKDMAVNCFLIAIVSFAINYSLCDVFSKKYKYKINTSQELLSYGACNTISSFFACFSACGSLSRSCVQNNAGGKTQFVSIVSSIVIGFVLAFIAPLFRELPQACLSSIILVALKGLLMQIGDMKFYFKVHKLEFFQFLTTFLSVVILDVDIGLGIGVGLYIVLHIARSTQPYSTLLGNITGTELYKDIKLYKDAKPIDKIKIIRVQSELHATNAIVFSKAIYEKSGVKPQDYITIKNKIKLREEKQKKKLEKSLNPPKYFKFLPEFIKKCLVDGFKRKDAQTEFDYINSEPRNFQSTYTLPNKNIDILATESQSETVLNEINNLNNSVTQNDLKIENYTQLQENHISNKLNKQEEDSISSSSDLEIDDNDIEKNKLKMPKLPIDFIIIDCSPIAFIDTVGVKTIKQLIADYNEINIKVYLADCNDAMRDRFKCMEEAESKRGKYLDDNLVHMTIHDAVIHALNLIKKKREKIRF